MRVIAGKLGGRNFSSPSGHRTHPMSDKIRGALFNALGDVKGLSVLDAFAGSGALSFEAVSRGAARALSIEPDRSAQRAISENIETLGIKSHVKLVGATAQSWLSTTDELFDIVLCDPPYNDHKPELLKRLAARARPSGIVVFSLPPTVEAKLTDVYQPLSHKNYGDASLYFYRRDSNG